MVNASGTRHVRSHSLHSWFCCFHKRQLVGKQFCVILLVSSCFALCSGPNSNASQRYWPRHCSIRDLESVQEDKDRVISRHRPPRSDRKGKPRSRHRGETAAMASDRRLPMGLIKTGHLILGYVIEVDVCYVERIRAFRNECLLSIVVVVLWNYLAFRLQRLGYDYTCGGSPNLMTVGRSTANCL